MSAHAHERSLTAVAQRSLGRGHARDGWMDKTAFPPFIFHVEAIFCQRL